MKYIISGILVSLLIPSQISSETIHGKIQASVTKKASSKRSYSRGVFEPKLKTETKAAAPGDSLAVLVWAEPTSGKAPFIAPEKKPLMNQKNKRFVPDLLIVQTGTVVGFPNLDPIYHNVFSYSKVKRFDLGLYPKGESKDITFDEEGVVEVFCEIHDHMHAYIIVVNTPYYTRTDNEGTFSFEVPPGRYNVFVWTPNHQSNAAQVDLTTSKQALVNYSF